MSRLPRVFSSVKLGNGTWAFSNALGDIFPISQSALADPLCQPSDGLFIAMLIVENQKSSHSCSFHQNMALNAPEAKRITRSIHTPGS